MRVVFSIGLGNNIGLRGGKQLFRADAVGAFNDLQAALYHIQNTQIGDNSIYHAGSGQGQAALLQNFTVAMLVGVIHNNHNAANTGHQIHRASHAFDQFPRNHPIGQIAVFGNFHGP